MGWTLIVNPVAGSGYALEAAKAAKAALDKRGEACEILYTQAPGHATELARAAAAQPDCRAVIAVGGDGTSFEVATGLAGTGKPMGVIPAGTGNDFIKTIGVPAKPLEALRFILEHEPRPLDIGRINDRHFLNVCGTGFDVTVLEQVEQAASKRRGLLPYLIGVLKAIALYEPIHVRYSIDGQKHEQDALICSVANGRYFGGGIAICPEAQVDDGLLDVVLVDCVPRWKVPFYLPGLLLGRILKFGITHHVHCREMHIISPEMRVQIDGELFTMDQADFAICPSELQFYW